MIYDLYHTTTCKYYLTHFSVWKMTELWYNDAVAAVFAVPHGGITQAGSSQCIPKAAELVAYRAQGAGNLSEFLQVVSYFSHTIYLCFWMYLTISCQFVMLYGLKCGIIWEFYIDYTLPSFSGVPRNFVGGVQQIQLRTEGKQNRDLGAVCP
jgi:hypothetical protein